MSVAAAVLRPSSAPSTAYLPLTDQNDVIEKCYVCARRLFTGSFAEICSSSNTPSKKPICSMECFQKYIHAHKGEPEDGKKSLVDPDKIKLIVTTVPTSSDPGLPPIPKRKVKVCVGLTVPAD